MLYLFAVSSWICEECFRYAVPSSHYMDLAGRPLPVEITYRSDSEEVVTEWGTDTTSSTTNKTQLQTCSIRMCLPCRQSHYILYPEPTPAIVQGRYLRFEGISARYFLSGYEINHLQCEHEIEQPHDTVIRVYSDEEAQNTSRRKHGGDIGSSAFQQGMTLSKEARKTVDRLCEYRRRYLWQPKE